MSPMRLPWSPHTGIGSYTGKAVLVCGLPMACYLSGSCCDDSFLVTDYENILLMGLRTYIVPALEILSSLHWSRRHLCTGASVVLALGPASYLHSGQAASLGASVVPWGRRRPCTGASGISLHCTAWGQRHLYTGEGVILYSYLH